MKDIIITAVVGAIIGYSTNWLAIKMLFRPHNEIRFLGIALPFTPGLIPKERYSIAKKLGQTISGNLMTTEVLAEAVASEETAEKFGIIMDGLIEKIQVSKATVGTVLMDLTGWEEEILRDKINLAAEALSAALVNNPSLRQNLKAASTEKALYFLRSDGFGEFLKGLRENMAGQKLGKYISQNDSEYLKRVIAEKSPEIMVTIQHYLIYNEDVDRRLKPLVHKVIDDNVSGLAGLFINRDRVYRSIRDGIIEYLGDEASQTAFVEMITSRLDGLLETDVEELFEKLPKGIFEGLSSLIKGSEDFDLRLEEAVSRLFDSALDGEFLRFASGMTGELLNSIIDMEIGVLANKISEGNSFDIKTFVLEVIQRLVRKYSHYLFDSINLSAVIEKQINTFGVQEAEDIIMSVVKRELNAITNLGGVLGFIIGLLASVI